MLTMKEIPRRIQPRERAMDYGVVRLTDQELLAILLRNGYENHSVMELSRNLLGRYSSLESLACLSVEELCTFKGIGKAKATTLLAAFELGKRLNFIKEDKVCVSSSEAGAQLLRQRLVDETKEQFFVLLLNTKNILISTEIVSMGSLDMSIVHPREVYKNAVKKSAAAIIIGHNHPSGSCSPSREDCKVTERLVEAGHVLGIPILDHIIIGGKDYYSFRENGQID